MLIRASSGVRGRSRSPALQKGFTLIELGIVATILIVIVALAVPKIEEKMIEGRIAPAGRDVALSIARLRGVSNLTTSTTPFATLPSMDSLFRDTNFAVNGAVVTHRLGTANGGQVVVQSIASGAAVAVTLWGLSPLNCPALSNQLQRAADVIEVGTSGTSTTPTEPAAPSSVPTTANPMVVKTLTTPYEAGKVIVACNQSGTNNFLRFYVNGTGT